MIQSAKEQADKYYNLREADGQIICDLSESNQTKDAFLMKQRLKVTEFIESLKILHNVCLAYANDCPEFDSVFTIYEAKLPLPPGPSEDAFSQNELIEGVIVDGPSAGEVGT